MRLDRFNKPLVWRGALAFLALVLFVKELVSKTKAPRFGRDTIISADEAPLLRSTSAPVLTYPAIALHPVFDPSRQPWVPPAVPQPLQGAPTIKAAPPPPRGYVLIGLVTSLHQHSALLRGPSGKTVFLTEGQLLTGWTVRQIDAHGVHLQAEGDRFEMTIPHARDTSSGRR